MLEKIGMKHQNYSNFNQGDIIILPVPFSDQSNKKLRPALIISDDLFNSKYPDLILLKITSIGHSLPFDVKINNKDLIEGELIKKSTINCGFLITAHKSIIKSKIGKISENKLKEIKEKFKLLFNL
jgi:mRNA interferase MazF